MNIVIAIDSFKGSMTSVEAGNAAANGIRRYLPDADIRVIPVADGGEGTVDALIEGLGGKEKTAQVKNPLGRSVLAKYGIVGDTAIIEMSAAAGLALIQSEERDPMVTTTYGVGEMIKDAVDAGCRDFMIGIGGSATNDGGVGMLQALGFEFLDENKKSVPFGAACLDKIRFIDDSRVLPAIKECRFNVACDVKNPLCGEFGCSAIYAPQKGATPEQVVAMDAAMAKYAAVTKQKYPEADPDFEGAGAAGGLGFAFKSYLAAQLVSGIELILGMIKLEDYVKNADLVITGEGRLDAQSSMGKAPVGIAKMAKKYQKTVFAFSGCVTPDARKCNQNGIDAFFPIVRTPCTLEAAMNTQNAQNNMADTAEQVIRAYLAGKNIG